MIHIFRTLFWKSNGSGAFLNLEPFISVSLRNLQVSSNNVLSSEYCVFFPSFCVFFIKSQYNLMNPKTNNTKVSLPTWWFTCLHEKSSFKGKHLRLTVVSKGRWFSSVLLNWFKSVWTKEPRQKTYLKYGILLFPLKFFCPYILSIIYTK